MQASFTIASFTCKTALYVSEAEGIRTPDLRRAKAALSQTSTLAEVASIADGRRLVCSLDAAEYSKRCIGSHAFTQDQGERKGFMSRRVCVSEGTS